MLTFRTKYLYHSLIIHSSQFKKIKRDFSILHPNWTVLKKKKKNDNVIYLKHNIIIYSL